MHYANLNALLAEFKEPDMRFQQINEELMDENAPERFSENGRQNGEANSWDEHSYAPPLFDQNSLPVDDPVG
jgi:hypothetical protein